MLETGTQRDKYLQELVQTNALLESAIQHNDVQEQEIERLRVKMAALSSLGETRECRPVRGGLLAVPGGLDGGYGKLTAVLTNVVFYRKT